jgi:hypothetical protein
VQVDRHRERGVAAEGHAAAGGLARVGTQRGELLGEGRFESAWTRCKQLQTRARARRDGLLRGWLLRAGLLWPGLRGMGLLWPGLLWPGLRCMGPLWMRLRRLWPGLR